MRLPAVPVTSLEDATLDFEALQTVLTAPGSSLPFLQLLTARNLQIAFGSGTVTFTASLISATTTVTHGIGRAPVFVSAFGLGGGNVWYSSPSQTTSTVTFQGNYYTATTGTFSFVWTAIG